MRPPARPPSITANNPAERPKANDPLDYLRSAPNRVVLVRLRDGHDYVGKLEAINNEMDVVLKDCEDKSTGAKYNRLVVRGNNVIFIDVDYEASSQQKK